MRVLLPPAETTMIHPIASRLPRSRMSLHDLALLAEEMARTQRGGRDHPAGSHDAGEFVAQRSREPAHGHRKS